VKEKQFNYVYLITNLVNRKQYVGEHSTNNLNDNYFGSSSYLKNVIKKYKKKNFKIQILEYFETKQEAFSAQEKYIYEYNTLIPNGYNISPTGGTNECGGSMNEISKQRLSKTRKEKYCGVGEKNGMFRKSVYDIWIEKFGKEEADRLNKNKKEKHKNYHPSKETKNKTSNTMILLRATIKPIWNKGLTKENDERIKKSAKTRSKIMKGRTLSEEHKKHKKEAQAKTPKILCPYCKRIINNSSGAYTKHHGDNCKLKFT
jgi:hypothetical protein